MIVERMIGASSRLRDDVESFADSLVKEGSVDAVYNPLAYAWKPHHAYLELASGGGAKTLLSWYESRTAWYGSDGDSFRCNKCSPGPLENHRS